MFVSLVPLSPLSLGIPSGVCVAGSVVTFVVGDSPLMFVLLVALSPLPLGIPLWCLCCWWRCHLGCWLFPRLRSHGWLHPPPLMACFTHRHSWLASPTATHGWLHPPPLMTGFTHRHSWLASPTATHGWLHPPPLMAGFTHRHSLPTYCFSLFTSAVS